MRLNLAVLGIIFTMFSADVFTERTYAQDAVSIDLFYQELSPYGEWSPHVEFGYIWQPYGVGPDWKPYTDGRWEWSDQGWIWISYEPWGWATYHYGRWVYDDYQGWIWIPGTTWAPAYVSWLETPDYVGWSPLPPDRGFFLEIGFTFNFYNSNYYEPYYYKKHHHKHHSYYYDYYHDPHHYKPPAANCVFLPYNKFANHKHALRAAAPPANYDIVLRNSKNVTNIKRFNNKVINYGPDKHYIESRSNQKLVKHEITDRDKIELRGNKNVKSIQSKSSGAYSPKNQNKYGNPYTKNRDVNNPANGSASHGNQKQPRFDNSPNPKAQNQKSPIKEPSRNTGYSKTNNPGEKKVKKKNISKSPYNSANNGNNNNAYKNRYQQNGSGQLQPRTSNKANAVRGNNSSPQNQGQARNFNYQNNRAKGINKYNNTQKRQNGSPNYQTGQKTVKKSENKNYSKKNQNTNNSRGNFSKGNSYQPKPQSMPVTNNPAFSRR